MSSNAERFLDAFAHIEKELRRLTGQATYTKFYQLLADVSDENQVVKQYRDDLLEYAELRNAIVHNRSEKGLVIAQPVDEVVDSIENIAALLCDNRLVGNAFCKEVKVCSLDDSLLKVANLIEKMETTKIPVYQNGSFMFLLTSEMIERCLIHHLKDAEKLIVRDCELYLKDNENVFFVTKNTHISTVRDSFMKGYTKGHMIKAVVITEHGNRNELPLGIITLSDVI